MCQEALLRNKKTAQWPIAVDLWDTESVVVEMDNRNADSGDVQAGSESKVDEWDLKTNKESMKISWLWNLAQVRLLYQWWEEVENSLAEENREIKNTVFKTQSMK